MHTMYITKHCKHRTILVDQKPQKLSALSYSFDHLFCKNKGIRKGYLFETVAEGENKESAVYGDEKVSLP